MLRVAICEDVLSELQKQTQIIQSIMARLSKNVKFFCFRSGEELLMETDTTGNMDIVFLDVECLVSAELKPRVSSGKETAG